MKRILKSRKAITNNSYHHGSHHPLLNITILIINSNINIIYQEKLSKKWENITQSLMEDQESAEIHKQIATLYNCKLIPWANTLKAWS